MTPECWSRRLVGVAIALGILTFWSSGLQADIIDVVPPPAAADQAVAQPSLPSGAAADGAALQLPLEAVERSSAIPEPSVILLFGVAVVAMGWGCYVRRCWLIERA